MVDGILYQGLDSSGGLMRTSVLQCAQVTGVAIRITCYGGVGQIGGNKVLLEDAATGGRLFLDFGIPFGERRRYFEEYLNPRASAGLLDLIELGLVPPFRGLYRPDLLDLQRLQNWVAHFQMTFVGDPERESGYHASGHASESELARFVREVSPRYFIPLHSEQPRRYLELLAGTAIEVRLPEYGVPLVFT